MPNSPQPQFTLDRLIALRSVARRVPLSFSPQGRCIAISVQGTHDETLAPGNRFTADGISDELLGSRLLLVDSQTGEAHDPLPSDAAGWAGRWSPDGRRLAAYARDGGYTVLAALVQTTCFKAAACNAARSNLAKSFGTGFAEAGQFRLGGTPWERRDAYIENSPFFYLDRVRTPLLLTCGTEDEPEGARETLNAFRRLAKKAELRLYPGESHGPAAWARRHQRDLYTRIVEWFDAHLGANA